MAEVIQYPFAAGQEEGVWDKEKRLRKRFGSRTLADTIIGGGAITSGSRLISRGSDIQIVSGANLYAYVSSASAWSLIDRPPSLRATWDTLIDTTMGVTEIDQDSHGGLLFVAYTRNDTDDMFLVVVEMATGAKVVRPVAIASAGSYPHVVVDSTQGVCHIFYSTLGGLLRSVRVNLTTLAISSAITVASGCAISTSFDVALSGADLYFAYELAAGANRLRVMSTDATSSYAVAASTDVNGAVTLYRHMGIAMVGSYVAVIWGELSANNVQYATFLTSTMAGVVAPTLVAAVVYPAAVSVIGIDATTAAYAYSEDTHTTPSAIQPTRLGTFDVTTGTGSPGALVMHSRLSSKLFSSSGRTYVAMHTLVTPTSTADASPFPQWTHVVVELEAGATADGIPRVMSSINPGTAWPTNVPVPKVAVGADGTYRVALAYAVDPPATAWAASPTPKLGYVLAAFTPAAGDIWRPVVAGPTPMCAAGAPFWADGNIAQPVGFLHPPMVLASGHSLGGGGQLAGTYLYAGVYVYKDADGREHRSPPSPTVTITTGVANETVTVTFATTSLSSRQSDTTGYATTEPSPVRIEVYRTTVNGSTLYWHSTALLNDPQVHSVVFTDVLADDTRPTLASRRRIYTDGGGLDDVAPPGFTTALAHRERIWGIAGDERTVWASKPQSEDPLVAPGFNEALTVGYSKRKTALGPLDSAVIVLGPESVDVIDGDGPDNLGQGGWARGSIQTDVGCIEPRSVVSIPPGLLFQSTRGIELLTRERTLTWIGKSVQDTLAIYPTITSAVLDAEHHIVRFTCNTASLASGIVLVFDYLRGAWAKHDYGVPVADAQIIGGVYTFLTYGGIVHQEDDTTYRDTGAWVPMSVEIPMSPSGPNAWQMLRHVQVLGTSVTDHQLSIEYAHDFASGYEQTKTFAAGTPVTRPGPLEQARLTPRHGKAQGFKVRIADAAPEGDPGTDTGQGPILEGLALYVQRKQGLPKTSAPRKG
jgi:hypothetical protein